MPETTHDKTAEAPTNSLGAFIALFAMVFAWGISFAGLQPLLALTLEQQGWDTLMIGVVAASTPVGVIIAAPFVAPIVRAMGTAKAMMAASIGALLTIALLPVFDSYGSWLFLRFASGLCGAIPWIVTETWLNTIVSDKNRAKVTALYGAIMAASFAIGPVMLTFTGTAGALPFVICTLLVIISLIPLVLVWRLAPVLHLPKGLKFSSFIVAMPSMLAAAFVCGFVDMSMFSFLPIWGMRSGFESDSALLLLSAFVLGNVFLQLPLGHLADVTNRRVVMLGCGIISTLIPVLLITMSMSLWAVVVCLFFWGGSVWALYMLSLAMLGTRYQGGALTAASAAFVIAYEIANIIGPPMAGYAITLWDPNGLLALMAGMCFLFCVLVIYRSLSKASD